MDGGSSREIEATVDTGAAYTTLPACLLHESGIEPMDRGVFLPADACDLVPGVVGVRLVPPQYAWMAPGVGSLAG